MIRNSNRNPQIKKTNRTKVTKVAKEISDSTRFFPRTSRTTSVKFPPITRFFCKQHFHKQRQAEIGKTSSKC